MAKLTALGHLGLAFETVFGTAVAPTFWLPYTSVKMEDDIKQIVDDGRRANLTKDYAVYNTTQEGKADISFYAYPDAIGYFLKGILGQDSVTGAATPYTHTFKVVNALAPSMTLSNFNDVDERQYAGAVMEEFSIKFDAETELQCSAKMISHLGVVGTTSTPSYSTLAPFLGYTLAAKIGGTANANIVGGEVTIKREAKNLFTATNTKDPAKYSAGRIEVTGKLTFDVEDATEYALYAQGNTTTLDLLFTQDANTSLDISFGAIKITKATFDESQEWLRVDLEYRAVYDTTDAGMTTITLKNAVATY